MTTSGLLKERMNLISSVYSWKDEMIMRSIVLVPLGLVVYVISVVLIFAFWCWFFDKPQEWTWFIPITTASFSLAIPCGFLEENFHSPVSAALVTIIVASFWVLFVIVDIGGSIADLVLGNTSVDNIDILMLYIDTLLNSKIFAFISVCLAGGTYTNLKK